MTGMGHGPSSPLRETMVGNGSRTVRGTGYEVSDYTPRRDAGTALIGMIFGSYRRSDGRDDVWIVPASTGRDDVWIVPASAGRDDVWMYRRSADRVMSSMIT